MILIFLFFILAIVFLLISYTYVTDEIYQNHSMLFFFINSIAAMIVLLTGFYLFIIFYLY